MGNSVQDANISTQIVDLHRALVEIIAVMNHPDRDAALLAEAGVKLDRTLLPLLIGVLHFGPIGVVELANRAGRDHTTVSRQLGKLESLGLIERRQSSADRRMREVGVTLKGREVTRKIGDARERIARQVLSGWTAADIETFAHLMRRLADAMGSLAPGVGGSARGP